MSQPTTAHRLPLQGVTPPLSRSDHSKQGASHGGATTSPRQAESTYTHNNIYILGIQLTPLSRAIGSVCRSTVSLSSYSKSTPQETRSKEVRGQRESSTWQNWGKKEVLGTDAKHKQRKGKDRMDFYGNLSGQTVEKEALADMFSAYKKG